jgi:hypothetical protein
MNVALVPIHDTLPSAAEDYRLSYPSPSGHESVCRIRVYRPEDKPAVIVATELRDNEGMSITNAAEGVHCLAWERAGFPEPVFFVEHHPRNFYGHHDVERFELVTFERMEETMGEQSEFGPASWKHLSCAEMRALIGPEQT